MSNTFDINQYHRRMYALRSNPRIPQVLPIECADGFIMSVQASSYHYSEPRQDAAWPYAQFEVGFPSRPEPLLEPYSQMTHAPAAHGEDPAGAQSAVDPEDNDLDVLSDVYPWVPSEVIDDIVHAHGGLRSGYPTE